MIQRGRLITIVFNCRIRRSFRKYRRPDLLNRGCSSTIRGRMLIRNGELDLSAARTNPVLPRNTPEEVSIRIWTRQIRCTNTIKGIDFASRSVIGCQDVEPATLGMYDSVSAS